MMGNNVVSKLLSLDSNQVALATSEVTLKLKKYGEEFTFPIVALSAEVATMVQDKMFTMRADTQDMQLDSYTAKCQAIINGCPEVFKNQDILRHFNTGGSAKKLIDKLLTSDELETLYNAIMELTENYDIPTPKKLDEEVKN